MNRFLFPGRTCRATIGLVCVLALLVPMAPAASAAVFKFVPATPKLGAPVAGSPWAGLAPRASSTPSAPAAARRWPTPGHFSLSAGGLAPSTPSALRATAASGWQRVGTSGLSVQLQPVAGAGALAVPAPVTSVGVDVLSEAASRGLGASGPAIRLVRTDGRTGSAAVGVRFDPTMLTGLFGGDYAARVRWVQVPQAAATPATAGRTAVPQATTAIAVGGASTVTMASSTLALPLVSGAATTLLATSTPIAANGTGSFGATSLGASASWDVSAQTGSFAWTYPLAGVPVAAGPSPSLALAYSSQSVDGETGSTNNQPSAVGDGWALAGTGFIERSYAGCAGDGQPTSSDLCWKNDNATISFAGHSGRIIKDTATGTWRLADDEGSRIEKLTGAGNTTNGGEYWRLTTTDGTAYYFGLNHLPGWVAGNAETQSAWTVPVAGNNVGEPCHGADFASSFCAQGWRWNLDYVVDPHGNSVALYYTPETNQYQRNGTTAASYTRGGFLSRVDYGMRAGTELTTAAPQRMLLDSANRCIPGSVCDSAHPLNWPDVPWDQVCPGAAGCSSNTSPTFFSEQMLAKVHAQILSGASYADVDTWTLTHSFPNPGDGTSAALWLDRITRTGFSGASSLAMPDVVFHGITMTNRVWAVDGLAPLAKFRIASIDTDTGASIAITYDPAQCTPAMIASLNASPQTNTSRCYPQWWVPQVSPPQPAQQDWFQIYPVTSVSTDPRTGGTGAPVEQKYYDYTGTPAYRWDTSAFTDDSKRNWSIYAGYNRVRVSSGDINTPSARTSSDYLFFQGMDGDRATTSGGTKSVSVTASDGSVLADSLWLAGRAREKTNTLGLAGPVVDDTITAPFASAVTANDGTLTARLVRDGTVSIKTTLSAGGARTTQTKTSYDTAGRPVAVDDLGDLATAADDRCTRTSYADNTTSWLREYPSEVTTVARTCASAPVLPGDAISDTRTSYDGAAWGSPATRGDATSTAVVKSYTGTTANWLTTATNVFDALGRRTASTDPRVAPARTTSTSFFPAAGGPVTQTVATNALGWTTTTNFDPTRGSETSAVDVNGHTTEATYDPLGRRTTVWLPNHLRATFPTIPSLGYAYTISTSTPNVIATTTLTPAGAPLTSYALYDGMLRPRQTQAPAEGGGIDLADTFYDAAGRPTLTSSPYYALGNPSGALFVPSTTVPSQTQTLYDAAGRVSAQILLGNGVEKWRTTHVYGGDHTDTTPPAGGTATTEFTDARGNITRRLQYHGPTPTGVADSTTYAFDARGAMTAMTDATGANKWTWAHDVLGRVTQSVDPDKGTTTSAYDDANRLSSTLDARGVTLVNTYDSLDRKIGEFTGSVAPANQLAGWSFDPAIGTTQVKGQLASSTRFMAGSSGPAFSTAITGYDALYNPTGSRTTIPSGYGPLTGSYSSAMAYGQDGSLTAYADPAAGGLPAETLGLGFDGLGKQIGLHTSTTSYLLGVIYDHLNRFAQSTQNQGATTLYRTSTYDNSTNRTIEALTQRSAASGAVVADRTFGYSNAGDVISASDNTPSVGVDTQCFSYDYTRQLSAAWTPNTTSCASAPTSSTLAGPAPYWQSYTYDAIGDRSSITRHATTTSGTNSTDTMMYPAAGAPQPHGVTAVTHSGNPTPDAYAYNADGSTRTRPAQVLTYDSEGHQASVSAGGATQSDLYDADGNRLLQTDPSGTTLYLGDTELHAAPGATTATGVRTYTALGGPIAERTTTAGVAGSHLFFLDTDAHSTATATIDTVSNTVARRHVDPFGNSRDASTPAWIDTHGFLNKPADALSATTHLGAREYDPSLGRFLSVDPVLDAGKPQQNNAYAYAWNNPVNAADPTGLMRLADGYNGYNGYVGTYRGGGGSTSKPAPLSVGLGACVFHPHASHAPAAGGGGSFWDNAKRWGAAGAAVSSDVFLFAVSAAQLGADPVTDVATVGDFALAEDAISAAMGESATVEEAAAATKAEAPLIKAGAEGGQTAGKVFSRAVKNQSRVENPSRCVYCRMETDSPQVDHAIPRSRGGNATLENAQTTCAWCNASKGARDYPVNPPPFYLGDWPPVWWGIP
jgi:RHS repeat-associated protein